MNERKQSKKERKVLGIAVIVITLLSAGAMSISAYGTYIRDFKVIGIGLFSLISLALAGLAMFLDKEVVLGFGEFKCKISSGKLAAVAERRAESAGKPQEEVKGIIRAVMERYPHGATVAYKPDGSAHVESTDRDVGLIEARDLATDLVLGPIFNEPPVLRPIIYHSNDKVPDSGIYLVVDKDGNWLGHENTYIEGKKFGPFNDERAAGYVFRRKTMFMKPHPVFLPGQPVEVSGIYDVVNENGDWIAHQEACRAGDVFPPVVHKNAYGYVLRESAIRKPV